jgi:hypothetical protein
MQTVIDDIQPDAALSEPAQANPYAQALAEIETRLEQLSAAFQQLDTLRAEEAELVTASDEIANEERAFLENPSGSERQATERLIRLRATKDIRASKLAAHRKKIGSHCDVIRYDVAEPLRQSFAMFANELLVHTEDKVQEMFDTLLERGAVPGIDNLILTKASTPVRKLERLGHSIGSVPPKDPAIALQELRHQPAKWLSELRAIVEAEANQ